MKNRVQLWCRKESDGLNNRAVTSQMPSLEHDNSAGLTFVTALQGWRMALEEDFFFSFLFAATVSVLPWVGGWGALPSSCTETCECRDGPDSLPELQAGLCSVLALGSCDAFDRIKALHHVLMCDTKWIHILCAANTSVSPAKKKNKNKAFLY